MPIPIRILPFWKNSTYAQGPELLAPAGSLDMMRTAFDFRAPMRSAPASRATVCACATTSSAPWKTRRRHCQPTPREKQFFVVSNIFPHNAKVPPTSTTWRRSSPEAGRLIMSDPA